MLDPTQRSRPSALLPTSKPYILSTAFNTSSGTNIRGDLSIRALPIVGCRPLPAWRQHLLNEQTFTNVMHLLDVLYKLWPIVCGVLAVGIIWWRTRSLFFLFHQILKWLGLEGKYSNPDDQKVADDYLDLNKFNLKTGFQLKSVKAKTSLHTWMRDHDLEFAVLRRAGWYFKANQLNFEIPGKWQTFFCRLVIILAGAAFIAGGQIVQRSDYALLKVNATGTWFWVGNNEAYSFRFDFPEWLRGDPWRIQQGDCRYVEDPTPVKDAWDKDVICRLVLGMNDGYIAEAIASQTNAAWVLTLFGAGCFGGMGLFAVWLTRAKELEASLAAASSAKSPASDQSADPDKESLPVGPL